MITSPYRTYLVACLKGGVRKTTTAIMLAFEFANRGHEVLLIDADTVTQGVIDWMTRLDKSLPSHESLPFNVGQLRNGDMLSQLIKFQYNKALSQGRQITHVIIDVGGEQPAVVREAALLADVVVIPTGTDQAEIGRIPATIATITQTDNFMFAVLLTRVAQPGKGMARSARDLIEGAQHRVLRAEIPNNRLLYADPWGGIPETTGEYADVATELEEIYDFYRSTAGALS